MQELCKNFLQTVKTPFLVFFLIIFLSSVVLSKQYTQDYNNPVTYSMGDKRWCKLNGVCTFDTITTEAIITKNLSVIGEVFNVTMNIVTWNITESFNVGGNLIAKNGTFERVSGNGSGLHSLNHSLDDAYDDGSVIQVDDTNVVWDMSGGARFNVTNNLFSNNKNISNLVRTATFVVCASDSKDTTNCDYFCDGTADEVEINNAIDSLPSTGGLILLMDGTFDIDAVITIDSDNTAISGMGKNTKIQTDDAISIIEATNLKDLLIKNIYLYGNGDSGDYCISFTNVNNSIIENSYIENCWSGILLYLASSFNLISGNIVDGNAYQGILIGADADADADYNIISDNIVVNNVFEGILLQGARHTTIQSNQVNSNNDSGIEILSNCHYSNIIGNQVNKNKADGIDLSNAEEAIIMNNIIRDNDFYDSGTRDGIYLEDSDNNLIFGNRVKDNDRYEIHIKADSDGNMIIGNNVIGIDHEDTIVDEGTNTTFSSNIEISGGSILMQGIYNFTNITYFLNSLSDGTNSLTVANAKTAYDFTTNGSFIPYIGAIKNIDLGANNFTIDTNTLFVDSTNNRVGIGQTSDFDPRTGLSISGDFDINHTATENDDHAMEIDVDAGGFGDVKGIDIVYTTGAISAGEEEEVILINIDESLAAGGDVIGVDILATEGSAGIYGLEAGALVNPVVQLSGTFTDMDSANNSGVDGLGNFTSTTNDTPIFVSDNDYIIIGDAAKFEELEFLLNTTASNPGIKPTFEYSIGVGDWGTFSPADGTNGMRNTGIIAWFDSDIPTWATGAGSEYLIRINRTQNNLVRTPIENKVQISAVTLYKWDKNGDLVIRDVNATNLRGSWNKTSTLIKNSSNISVYYDGDKWILFYNGSTGAGGGITTANGSLWNKTSNQMYPSFLTDWVGFGHNNPNAPVDVYTSNYHLAEFRGNALDAHAIVIDAPSTKDTQINFQEATATFWSIGWDGSSNTFKMKKTAGAFSAGEPFVFTPSGSLRINDSLNATNISVDGICLGSSCIPDWSHVNISGGGDTTVNNTGYVNLGTVNTSTTCINNSCIDDWSDVNVSGAGGVTGLDTAYDGGENVIDVDTDDVVWNLTSTQDFIVQDNGVTILNVSDIGNTYIGSQNDHQILAWTGRSSYPSYSFVSDTQSGLYSSQLGKVAIVTEQSIRGEFSDRGIQIGPTGSKTSPSYSWTGDTDTGLFKPSTDYLGVSVGGIEYIRLKESTDDEFFINELGVDMNFRIETDTEVNMIYIDGADNYMNIAGGYGSTGVTIYDNGSLYMNGNLIVDGFCLSEGADCNADIAELTHSKASADNTTCNIIEEYNETITHSYYNYTSEECSYELKGNWYEHICVNVSERYEFNNISEICSDNYELVEDNKYKKVVNCVNETPTWTEEETIIIPRKVECSLNPNFELEFESGDVVCIDKTDPNHIKFCDKQYDTSVVGVINYNPTMIIGQRSPYPLSLSGNVPVKVICNTPIEIGDLLVSSSHKGYAQSIKTVTPTTLNQVWNKIGSPFAKSLESCNSGNKTIRAWI